MKFLIIALIAFLPFHSYAQNSIEKEAIISLYTATQHFQFKRADSIIRKLPTNSPAALLARSNYFWWLIISGKGSMETRKNCVDNIDAALKLLPGNSVSELDNEQLYSYIVAYAYKARLEALNKNYVKGMVHINNCVSYLETSLGKESRFELFKLTSGLYHYYISTAGKDHPYLLPYLIFLPSGDHDTGIKLLSEAANQNSNLALKTEACYFLMKIYMEKDDPQKAIGFCRTLRSLYPSNLLYHYYSVKLLLEREDEKTARNELENLKISEMKSGVDNSNGNLHFYPMAKSDLEAYSKVKRNP